MKKVIHYGAGNIGRGFIGKILSDNSYEVTFIDVNEAVINQLNTDNEYIVEVVGKESREETVKNVNGLMSGDMDNILELSLKANLITTAIGPNVLKIISKSVAEIIKFRMKQGIEEFLNIIACENMIKGSTFLKENVLEHLGEEEKKYAEKWVGFADSAVDRIVPPANTEGKVVTYVMVEEFYEWIVDENQIKGKLDIEGMIKTDNLMAYIERKLFTLNTGHAITAYLGWLNGLKTIEESIFNTDIRKVVNGAMSESGEVLIKRYGFQREKHYQYIEKILKRFENPYLKDDVARVGRQPIRKLGKNERLIKPLLGTLEYNVSNEYLITGIAAALRFKGEDEESIMLEKMITEKGVEETLKEITGNTIDDVMIDKIMGIYEKMGTGTKG